jgi:hypothetical protein
MVSDPNQSAAGYTSDELVAGRRDTSALAYGFTTASAVPAAETEEEIAERASLSSRLSAFCRDMWRRMRAGSDRQGHTVVGDPDMFSPYKKAWWSTRVDSHVYDCGNGFRMEGTVRNPVDRRQIESMVRAALNKKDPPMDMLYIYDHNGRRDLKMAAAVQSVIMEMGLTGRINCCTDPNNKHYAPTLRAFDRVHPYLKNVFNNNAEGQKAPGFHASRNVGFGAAPA